MSIIVEYMVSKVDKLTIRSGPSRSKSSIGIINKDDIVEYLGISGSWSKIKYKEIIGYVYSEYLDKFENTKVINSQLINLRKGPSTTYETITSIPKGNYVEIIPCLEGWTIINYQGILGYVPDEYLSKKEIIKEEITKKIVNTDSLNCRKGPSTKDEIISKISKGSEVDVLSESGGWSKIKYNNKIGYVYSKYLSNKTTDMDSITTSASAEKILAYAKTLLGKPYIWSDEGPNSFDCSGFTWYVFKNVAKISLPRVSTEQGAYGIYVERKSLKPADLVFFDTVGVYDKKITHVGIYMGDNKFIHASSGQGRVVISDLTSTYYSKAFVNGRRVLK